METIEVKQQEEADMIKSHSQLPMYNAVMEVKVEGKLKLSRKDTGDKRLHREEKERMYNKLICTAGRVPYFHALYLDISC